MFKECKCRIFVDRFKQVYPIVSMAWDEKEVLQYVNICNTHGIATRINLLEKDIIMNFIGQHDKNHNELWCGDIVKWDPKGHKNFILGLITYDVRTTSYVIEQITTARDYFQTQEELNDQYKEDSKEVLQYEKLYKFDYPTNWYSVMFYDYDGSAFAYSELEKIGNMYDNPELLVGATNGTEGTD